MKLVPLASILILLGLPTISRAVCTSGPLVEAVEITNLNNGTVVDTSEAGTATGAFFLKGFAPPDAPFIEITLDGDEGDVASATIIRADDCAIAWRMEVQAKATDSSVTFVATDGVTHDAVTLQVIKPTTGAALSSPYFAFQQQFHGELIDYDNATGIMVFIGDLAEQFEKDMGLVNGEVPGIAPFGYARIILNAFFDGTNTILQTREAALTEMLRIFTISETVSGDPFDVVEPSDGGVALRALALAEEYDDNGRELIALGPNTELTFTAKANPEIKKFEIDIDLVFPDCWLCIIPVPELKTFNFEAYFEFNLEVKLQHKIEELFKKEKTNFGRKISKTLAVFTIPTPLLVPIIAVFELEVQPFYEAEIAAVVEINFKPTTKYTIGYEYGGRGSYSDGPHNSGGLDTITIDAGIASSAAVGLEMDLEVEVYGVNLVELEGTPKVQLEINLFQCEFNWAVNLVFPIGVGFELEILDHEIFDIAEIEFGAIVINILEGKIPFCSEAPSAGPSGPAPSVAPSYANVPSAEPTATAAPSPAPSPGPTMAPTQSTPPTNTPTTPQPTPPPPSPPITRGGSSHPDPHFRTWTNYAYDYHGECDLVLVKSAKLDIHIRTKALIGWSAIVGAAIRIKDGTNVDLLEMQLSEGSNGNLPSARLIDVPDGSIGPVVFFNGQAIEGNEELLAQLVLKYKWDGEKISLPGDQFIRLGVGGPSFEIYVIAHDSYIGDAVGMYGTWRDPGNAMLNRGGTIRYNSMNANLFGEEWQVNEALDGKLFMDSGAPACTYMRRRSLDVSPMDIETAEAACAGAYDDAYRQDCVFDVITTNDTSWANLSFYQDPPAITMVEDGCIAEGEGNACEAQGGTCVWRCNMTANNCDKSMCKGRVGFDEFSSEFLDEDQVDGCACALPQESTGQKCNILSFLLQLFLGWLFGLFGIQFCDSNA